MIELVQESKKYVESLLKNKLDRRFTYHNLEHTLLVYESSLNLAMEAKLSSQDRDTLLISALFHDTGFTVSAQNHEAHSQKIAKEFLESHNVEGQFIDHVLLCIDATRLGSETDDRLSQLLQDADMSGLAHKNFFEITEGLRTEENLIHQKSRSKAEWLQTNIEFLESCVYKSEEGKILFEQQKNKNLKKLLEKQKKKMKNPKQPLSITSSKNAQTQFKTALRNHIDLSNIADNKANIMISVNALILTVALPFLVERAMDVKMFWVPTILLAAVCLASMIFATLATRPIQMSGITTKEQIDNRRSNLFFFGNFYKMKFEDYQSFITDVIEDEKKLDNSIISDLFYLGKSLGKKFSFLRLCYNIFMYGVSAAVISIFIIMI